MIDPEVFTADYTGEPGSRTFYVQSRDAQGVDTFLVEKQQVTALAEKLRELLLMVDAQDTVAAAAPARDPALVLHHPAEPRWRVGTIGLAYDEDRDGILVVLQPPGEESSEDVIDPSSSVQLLLRRDQARSFVLHALAVVSEGRPLCQLCGLPIDPQGHDCPASNGHRRM